MTEKMSALIRGPCRSAEGGRRYSFYSYHYDRISGTFNIPNLADIIAQRAKELNLAASRDSSP
jgi:hypothetical protein